MGYYADLVDGDPFTITEPGRVLDHLASTEGQHGHARVYPVATYRNAARNVYRATRDDVYALFDIVTAFEFDAVITDTGVEIHSWNGEKWSGSATQFFQAFAEGTTDRFVWFFRGEDGEEWAEMNGPDGFRECGVTVTRTVNA